jgi:Flp pilus assembly pilin Flp
MAYGAERHGARALFLMVGRVWVMFERLWRDRRGASLIEYSILVAMITAIVVVAVAVAGSWIYGVWVHLLAMLS